MGEIISDNIYLTENSIWYEPFMGWDPCIIIE